MVRIGEAQRQLAFKMKAKSVSQKKQDFIKDAFAKKQAFAQKHASLKERVSVKKGGFEHARKSDHAAKASHAKKAEHLSRKSTTEVNQRDRVSISDNSRGERREKVAKVVKRIAGFLRGRFGRRGRPERTEQKPEVSQKPMEKPAVEQKPIEKPQAPQVLGKPSAGNGATTLDGEEGNGGTTATVTLKPQGGPTVVTVKPTPEPKPIEIKGRPETKLDPEVVIKKKLGGLGRKGRGGRTENENPHKNARAERQEMRLARKIARKLRFRQGIQKRMMNDQAQGAVLGKMEAAAQKVSGVHKLIDMQGLQGNKGFSVTGVANAQGDFIAEQTKSAGSLYSRGAVATSLDQFEKASVKPSKADKLEAKIGGKKGEIEDYMTLANEQAALISENPASATGAQGAIEQALEQLLNGEES